MAQLSFNLAELKPIMEHARRAPEIRVSMRAEGRWSEKCRRLRQGVQSGYR
jgi:hypothetical protein